MLVFILKEKGIALGIRLRLVGKRPTMDISNRGARSDQCDRVSCHTIHGGRGCSEPGGLRNDNN